MGGGRARRWIRGSIHDNSRKGVASAAGGTKLEDDGDSAQAGPKHGGLVGRVGEGRGFGGRGGDAEVPAGFPPLQEWSVEGGGEGGGPGGCAVLGKDRGVTLVG